MPRYLSIPDALTKFGLKVAVVDGWSTRGNTAFEPKGVVGHHTAGPAKGDRPSLDVCVHGRKDLPGPLCNVFLPRGLTAGQQTAVVVAAGRANHAGVGSFRGLKRNNDVWGVEAESTGVERSDGSADWTEWQLWAYPRIVAALLTISGHDETWYCAHRTWAPTRKIDPAGISDAWMRRHVGELLRPPPLIVPPSITKQTLPVEDHDMFITGVAGSDTRQFLITGGTKTEITTADKAQLASRGVPVVPDMLASTLNLWPNMEQISELLNLLPDIKKLVTPEDPSAHTE